MRIFSRRGAIAVIVGLAVIAAGGVWAVRRTELAYHIDQVEWWAAEDDPAERLADIERLAEAHPNSAALQSRRLSPVASRRSRVVYWTIRRPKSRCR